MLSDKRLRQICQSLLFSSQVQVFIISTSRLTEELDYRPYLRAGEHSGVVLVPHGQHGLPHAAGLVHLAEEEAQDRLVQMGGVIHLGKDAKEAAA